MNELKPEDIVVISLLVFGMLLCLSLLALSIIIFIYEGRIK